MSLNLTQFAPGWPGDPDKNPMIGHIVAIDGPAGAGKGTLARTLAGLYHMKYLDTGTLYRAVALRVIQNGGDPAHEADALAAADFKSFDYRHIGDDKFSAFIDEQPVSEELRRPDVGAAASKVAFFPSVREHLLAFQQTFAETWQERTGIVLDGRDIGTVICPHANHKIFLDANPEIRARRRLEELAEKGLSPTYNEVLAEVLERDARDRGRPDAPLKPAKDAIVIDSSNLDVVDVVRLVVEIIGRDKLWVAASPPLSETGR